MNIDIDKSWKKVIGEEFNQPYMQELKVFLKDELKEKQIVYPHGKEIFSAFNLTPFKKVKVVIIGQDPYHGPGQAHGACFSVKPGVKVPPSLKNIYKEMKTDLKITQPDHGFLEGWAKQGVLLLNNVLTVRKSSAGSHRGKGWEQFTDQVVKKLNDDLEGLVFLLWGRDAKTKGQNIDRQKHLVLEAAHPSPFSAHNFLGCRHFSLTNKYLLAQGKAAIDWQLTELN